MAQTGAFFDKKFQSVVNERQNQFSSRKGRSTAKKFSTVQVIDDIKRHMTWSKIENLDQISVQKQLNVNFTKETWEKFH